MNIFKMEKEFPTSVVLSHRTGSAEEINFCNVSLSKIVVNVIDVCQ